MILKRDSIFFFFKLVLRKLFVINAVTFTTEIGTKKAVGTISTIITELTVTTYTEFLAKIAIIASVHIDYLIAIFRIIGVIKIDTIF